jgi:hypothetical protein
MERVLHRLDPSWIRRLVFVPSRHGRDVSGRRSWLTRYALLVPVVLLLSGLGWVSWQAATDRGGTEKQGPSDAPKAGSSKAGSRLNLGTLGAGNAQPLAGAESRQPSVIARSGAETLISDISASQATPPPHTSARARPERARSAGSGSHPPSSLDTGVKTSPAREASPPASLETTRTTDQPGTSAGTSSQSGASSPPAAATDLPPTGSGGTTVATEVPLPGGGKAGVSAAVDATAEGAVGATASVSGTAAGDASVSAGAGSSGGDTVVSAGGSTTSVSAHPAVTTPQAPQAPVPVQVPGG